MSKTDYQIELPTQKPQVHPKHPFKNPTTHEYLLQYLRVRLADGVAQRDSDIDRYVSIDKHVAGWMRLSETDRKRVIEQEQKGIPQALLVNLPLTFVHIDDMMTYYAATFAPNRGMFYVTAEPDESDVANDFVKIMNNHAIYSGYFRQVLGAIYNILKYNQGGLFGVWSSEQGPQIGQDDQGNPMLTSQTVWEGNRVESLDVYNTFHDPFVHPTKVYCDGEWGGRSKLISKYQLQLKASQGIYFNVEEALKMADYPNAKYYRHPPTEARMEEDQSTGSNGVRTNWVAYLSGIDQTLTSGYELTEVYIRLNPWQLNLVPRSSANSMRNQLELWRITLLNDTWIIEATAMTNMHGYIPLFFGTLNDDLMEKAAKSVAEILKPLQNFVSFLMNTHIAATRKNIWGLTVYDPTVMDLSAIPPGEVSAMIASKPMAAGKKIQDYIYQHNSTLETKQTMTDVESVFGIVNQFFPTQSLPSQIAGMDRAVTNQVSAVQQGANRRMQKGSRLIDDTLFRPLRVSMYYNIIQFQAQAKIADFYGKTTDIDLDKAKQTDLPYIIGQGLKAIDRMALAEAYQQIIFAMIQAPQTGQQFDIAAMIEQWGNMVDMDIVMKQFRIQQPQNLATEGAPGDATAAGITPATNPQNVTAPIYG